MTQLRERGQDSEEEDATEFEGADGTEKAAAVEKQRLREDGETMLKRKGEENDDKAQEVARKKQKIEEKRLAFERKTAKFASSPES